MYDFNFDLGEYAPDKLLAFGTSSVEEYTNELKKRSIETHRQLLEMFKKQLNMSHKIMPVSRPVFLISIIRSITGLDLGFDSKNDIERMQSVNLTNWNDATSKLIKIIDEMIEKVEA